uniref:Secreted protein n=1 Tax=Hippocampus comes TaxID=109280 RepID=A0A3Q2YCX0_HIPCM
MFGRLTTLLRGLTFISLPSGTSCFVSVAWPQGLRKTLMRILGLRFSDLGLSRDVSVCPPVWRTCLLPLKCNYTFRTNTESTVSR